MRAADWIVLAGTIVFIIFYGFWRGRRHATLNEYMLAGRRMPWWKVMVSVMATQASALTFLSLPGQAAGDGMRFVQFYFGLPLAMLVLAVTAVPIYHNLGVYTAYEYLEKRFDRKTRTLSAVLFMLQRGLATGISIYTPALVLSTLLGWPVSLTTVFMGALAITYTTFGGSKAVGETQFLQFIIIMAGMGAAVVATIQLLPAGVSAGDVIALAGETGRTKIFDFSTNLNDRYTVWSGLIGGFFLQMSYFGADQSQVGRYLTGASIHESRLGLLFNGLLKIPMQLGIMAAGLLVFGVYVFIAPPLHFNPVVTREMQQSPQAPGYAVLEEVHRGALDARLSGAMQYINYRNTGSTGAIGDSKEPAAAFLDGQRRVDEARAGAKTLIQGVSGPRAAGDTDYIFLRFILDHLPAGLIGFFMAGIFCASLSASAAQLQALAATSVVDIYGCYIRPTASDAARVRASQIATVGWGVFAIAFAQFAGALGSLIEAVNELGSLFYGTILGIFLTAFYIKKVGGTAVFYSAVFSEIVVIALRLGTGISYLWFNVAGCLLVMAGAWALQKTVRTGNWRLASTPRNQ